MQTKFSQVQAARAAGVSRVTIYRAIKSGMLSVTRDTDGRTYIDASELVRVYPDANLGHAREHAPGGAQSGAASRAEQGQEHAHSAELHALRAHLEEVRDDKRRQAEELARAAAERAELLAMLRQKDEALAEKDRLLGEQMRTVKLLTDARPRPRRWWQRWRNAE